MPAQDPFNQYGYSNQSPSLGRYVPPMMGDYNNPNSWMNSGGYAYNIPNSYGNPQYTGFNATGRPSPQFGQSPNIPSPDWRSPPQGGPPQLSQQEANVMRQFMGLPGMSEITAPYREQLQQQQQAQLSPISTGTSGKIPAPMMNDRLSTRGKSTSPGEGGMWGQMDQLAAGGSGSGGGAGGVRDLFGRVGEGLQRVGRGALDWMRNEYYDRNGLPSQGPRVTPPGQPYFGVPSSGAGGAPVGPNPGYNPYNTYANPPGLGPTPGGGSIPNPYLSNQSPARGQPTGPEQGGYTPYSFGGNQGSQLGPTPSGGMRAPTRSTRGATGYRLNASMQGINALRDQQALDDIGLRNWGALRQ